MATYSRKEVNKKYVEFWVPTNGLYGACWVEVKKAIDVAWTELHTVTGTVPTDDAITIHNHDEHIIVRYEVKQ